MYLFLSKGNAKMYKLSNFEKCYEIFDKRVENRKVFISTFKY
jgi:hypothetical protein